MRWGCHRLPKLYKFLLIVLFLEKNRPENIRVFQVTMQYESQPEQHIFRGLFSEEEVRLFHQHFRAHAEGVCALWFWRATSRSMSWQLLSVAIWLSPYTCEMRIYFTFPNPYWGLGQRCQMHGEFPPSLRSQRAWVGFAYNANQSLSNRTMSRDHIQRCDCLPCTQTFS